MGLLANFKIRTKVLIASLPLAVMVIVAAMYASIEMSRIDTPVQRPDRAETSKPSTT